MPNYSVQDFEDLQTKSNQVLAKLEELDIHEWQKKKDLIEEYVLVNRTLLENGKLEIGAKKDFCSYIVSKLNERNITVNQNGNFYRMFNDDEKDSRGPKSIDLKSIEISSASKTVDEQFRAKALSNNIPCKNTRVTELLKKEREGLELAIGLNEAFLKKYNESEEIQKILDQDLNEEYAIALAGALAVLDVAIDNIDDRVKLSDSQKCNLQFLMMVGDTKANAAKNIGICSKYASRIERDPLYEKYWEFINKNIINGKGEKDYRDELIKRGLRGEELGIDMPIKGY